MVRGATAWKWHFHEPGSSPAVTCISSSAWGFFPQPLPGLHRAPQTFQGVGLIRSSTLRRGGGPAPAVEPPSTRSRPGPSPAQCGAASPLPPHPGAGTALSSCLQHKPHSTGSPSTLGRMRPHAVLHTEPVLSSPPAPTPKISYKLSKINLF